MNNGSGALKNMHETHNRGIFFSVKHVCFLLLQAIQCVACEEITYPYPYPVSVKSNGLYRQDYCDQLLHAESNKSDLIKSLSGKNLSVFLVNDNPTFVKNSYEGILIELLDEVARRANFSWRNSHSIGNLTTTGISTYDELLKWSTNHYDISASHWDQHIDRILIGSVFPYGWYDESLVLVEIEKPEKKEVNYLNFLNPFHYMVWALIGATIVFSGLTYYVLILLHVGDDAHDITSRNPISTSLFISAMTFTGNFDYHPINTAARILSFSIAFWALLISASYTANLASFLVVRNTPVVEIKSMKDISKKQTLTCILDGTFSEQLLKGKYSNANFVKSNATGVVESLKTGECDVAIIGKSTYDIMKRDKVNNDCLLSHVGTDLTRKPSGFAVRIGRNKCTYHLYSVLELFFMELEADGFIKQTWDKYLRTLENQKCVTDPSSANGGSSNNRLDVKDMAGIFALHAILSVVALCVAVVSFCHKKYVKRRSDLPHQS